MTWPNDLRISESRTQDRAHKSTILPVEEEEEEEDLVPGTQSKSRPMHAGLAALADEASGKPPGSTFFAGLVAKAKAAVTNREAIRVAMGKQVILARSFFDPRTFSKPESQTVAIARIRANFAHYRSLYAGLGLVVLLYTVLSSPMLLLGLTMLAGAWAYAFVLNAPEDPISVAGAHRRAALSA